MKPGTQLGPYEIVAPLGAGGMGQVFRARDTRLGREVALKVMIGSGSRDPGLRERFQREARALSSLQHPHIAALFDVGEALGVDFLVMELLAGEDLAQRLSTGPLKLDQALAIAIEIADALAHAHKHGIVHRDLKPSNVMLTKNGAKVLDFGIAKLVETSDAAGHRSMLGALPTRATPLTGEGTLVGTLRYMAPEQLEGKAVDHRADLFSLGATLHEMVSGQRAFDGPSQASVIAQILERDPPPPSSINAELPPAIDRLVRDLLRKDPDQRRQSAHDLASELRAVRDGASSSHPISTVRASSRSVRRWPLAAALGTIGLLFGGLLGTTLFPSGAGPRSQIELSIPLRAGSGSNSTLSSPAISPNGSAVIYVDLDENEKPRLMLQDLADAAPRQIEAKDSALRPFWSPDGKEIAYFARGKLWSQRIDNGRPRELCDAEYGVGGSWGKNGTIIFSPRWVAPLQRVSSDGGTAEDLFPLDKQRNESGQVWPQFLPDGDRFLYLSRTTPAEPSRVMMSSLSAPGQTTVILSADALVGFANEQLLFQRRGVIYAQPFDPSRAALSGQPEALADGSRYVESWSTGQASVLGDLFIWSPYQKALAQGEWFDSSGHSLHSVIPLDDVRRFRLSRLPDRAYGAIFDPLAGASDPWVFDLARGTRTRLAETPGDENEMVETPDGSELIVASDLAGPYTPYRVPVDGSRPPKMLGKVSDDSFPTSWLRDGKLMFDQGSPRGDIDILAAPIDRFDQMTQWRATPATEHGGRVSPDGNWVVFSSDRNGTAGIYLSTSDGRRSTLLTRSYGAFPMWGDGGRAIWFLSDDNRLHKLRVIASSGDELPETEETDITIDAARAADYSVAPDGRVLVLRRVDSSGGQLRVRLNWGKRR